MRCFHCMRELPEQAAFCPYCGNKPHEKTPPHHLAAGTVLHERYWIGNAIGEGGFGITYLGMDTMLDLKVAVKEYYPSGVATRNNTISNEVTLNLGNQGEAYHNGKESFLREAKSIAKFSQEEGIVDVRDYFTENNTAYIVMEYLDGETLSRRLQREGVMDAGKTFDLLTPLMRTLEKMHAQNVIHRDISPDNIMCLYNGKVKLMDFGAARQFSEGEMKSLSVVLKPGFAPYEQYSRRGKQGAWTDVYALCATIYRCVTGENPPDSLDRIESDDLKKPSELGIRISPDLEAALLKGLAVYPKDRLQSVGELIRAATVSALPHALPVTPAADQRTVYAEEVTDPPRKRKKKAPLLIGAAAVLILALLGIFAVRPFFARPSTAQKNAASEAATAPIITAPSANGTTVPLTQAASGAAATDAVPTAETSGAAETSRETAAEASAAQEEAPPSGNLSQSRGSLIAEHTLSSRYYHNISVQSDGTVAATGWNASGQCDLGGWSNVKQVAAGYDHSLGLTNDGSVLAAGSNSNGQCNVGGWSDIVAVSSGYQFSAGLKSDGTVVAVGLNDFGQCNVSGWKNIVSISAGYSYIAGLKADGTVVTAGSNKYGQGNVSGWTDIVSICAEGVLTVGLKSNGTVVAAGSNDHGQREVSGWTDIVAIGAGDWHTVGLRSDGTVVAVGSNSDGQCDVSGWTDIVAISVGAFHTVGVKSDGSLVATGRNKYHQCDVASHGRIKMPPYR